MTVTKVFHDHDDHVIGLRGNWSKDVWGKPSSKASTQGGYSWSDDPSAYIQFEFSKPALCFKYFGQPQLRPEFGTYKLCLDCEFDDETANWTTIVASVDNGYEDDPPVVLFERRFPKPERHTVLIKNIGGKESDLTIHKMELTVQDHMALASDPSTVTMTVTETITTECTSTDPPEPSRLPPTPSSTTKAKLSTGEISGIAVGTFMAILCLLLILLKYYRRKKSYQTKIAPFTYSSSSPRPMSNIPSGESERPGQARRSSLSSSFEIPSRSPVGQFVDLEKGDPDSPDQYMVTGNAQPSILSTTDSMRSRFSSNSLRGTSSQKSRTTYHEYARDDRSEIIPPNPFSVDDDDIAPGLDANVDDAQSRNH